MAEKENDNEIKYKIILEIIELLIMVDEDIIKEIIKLVSLANQKDNGVKKWTKMKMIMR